jgi:hypothetical protein
MLNPPIVILFWRSGQYGYLSKIAIPMRGAIADKPGSE